jgi:putative nucleotidyltransferase with HDIG domain
MMRIVFVDDDPDMLTSLRRSMRDMRNEWTMEFALSGAAALADMAMTPADVVVTEMRMPGMDGWELLTEVKKRYPQTVRLVLSGDEDAASIMRVVGTAQQYLAKPCDSGELKAAITRVYELRKQLSSDRLARLVGRVDMLPVAPTIFQDFVQALQRPSASIAEVAKIISRDVAMTANVIKLVNSAFFGLRQPLTTAVRAVAYLGLDTIGALVLGQGVLKSGSSDPAEAAALERLWQHSLEVATTARFLAQYENLSPAKADEAFLAGTLHDVGKVVFAMRRATGSEAAAPASDGAAALQMQSDHAEVGAYLLGLWGFPSSIVEAVALHHSPKQLSGQELSLPILVHLADRLVHQRHGDLPASVAGDGEQELLQRLGLAAHWPAWLAGLDTAAADQAAADQLVADQAAAKEAATEAAKHPGAKHGGGDHLGAQTDAVNAAAQSAGARTVA